MWPIRNYFALLWLTEVDSDMKKQSSFLKSLTESDSTEMKERVKDCGEQPPAPDSHW